MIASHTAGRLRLREKSWQAKDFEIFADKIQNLADVENVRTNPTTKSVLIFYQPNAKTTAEKITSIAQKIKPELPKTNDSRFLKSAGKSPDSAKSPKRRFLKASDSIELSDSADHLKSVKRFNFLRPFGTARFSKNSDFSGNADSAESLRSPKAAAKARQRYRARINLAMMATLGASLFALTTKNTKLHAITGLSFTAILLLHLFEHRHTLKKQIFPR